MNSKLITSPKLKRALKDLTVMHPFWATLALHYDFVECKSIPTFSVNGKQIKYNPKFCESISVGVNMFAIAHECGHPMFDHLNRIFVPRPGDGKIYGYSPNGKPFYWQPQMWNVAGDYLINSALKESKFELWKDCLIDKAYDHATMTTEQIYNLIEQKHPPKPPQPIPNGQPEQEDDNDDDTQDGSGDGAGSYPQPADDCPKPDRITGNDIEEPAEGYSQQEMREILVRAAAVAKAQGKLPAGLESMIKAATEPQYPVYALLERFVDMNMQDDDSSWKKPHRDFFNRGIVLPSDFSEKLSHVILAYDTSGSIGQEELSKFHRIATDIILRLKPAKLTLMQCDADVHNCVDYTPNRWPTGINVTGGGGTSFAPVFEMVKEKRFAPSCLVYLTDLMGSFPGFAPNYPVLWVSTAKGNKAPFGTTIFLNQ